MKWWKIAIFLAGIFSLTVAIIARNLNAEKYRAFICKDVEFLSFDVDGSTDWIQFNLGYNYYMFSPSIGIKFYNDDYNLDKEVLKRMKILIKYGDSEMVCINGDEIEWGAIRNEEYIADLYPHFAYYSQYADSEKPRMYISILGKDEQCFHVRFFGSAVFDHFIFK